MHRKVFPETLIAKEVTIKDYEKPAHAHRMATIKDAEGKGLVRVCGSCGHYALVGMKMVHLLWKTQITLSLATLLLGLYRKLIHTSKLRMRYSQGSPPHERNPWHGRATEGSILISPREERSAATHGNKDRP